MLKQSVVGIDVSAKTLDVAVEFDHPTSDGRLRQ